MYFPIVALDCLALFGQQATMYNIFYYYKPQFISFLVQNSCWQHCRFVASLDSKA